LRDRRSRQVDVLAVLAVDGMHPNDAGPMTRFPTEVDTVISTLNEGPMVDGVACPLPFS